MRVPQTYLQHTKAGVHFAQAVFIFITGCLALVVLTKAGGTSGATGFLFGMCFLTIPALIYQVMVPMWTRAWRFANVYAYAALDIFFATLWLAAFIAVAIWNSAGIREGEKDKKDSPDSGNSCSHFAYGSATKCEVSEASVGCGVIICLLFAVTSAISMQGIIGYRRTGIMPNGNSRIHGQAQQLAGEDASKDPWNASTDELEPGRDSQDERQAYGPPLQREQGVGLLGHDLKGHHRSTDASSHGDVSIQSSPPHPGRPLSYASGNPTDLSVTAPAYDERLAPSALSPGGYQQSPGGRVHYP
ncbi:hypothetical protein B0A55_03480 [Friedmanniomyces simplex]|uniref:MARVEL domain-containing protein n=1 Tax=Friedmanniomyces simplex TaxID=329884 RepID=A0A4U0XP18_9PEZI|nr:hypothetical protein B0A55_03480 [Friedmanniomyces simplex]